MMRVKRKRGNSPGRPVAREALRADDRGRGLDRPFAFALSALAVLVVAAGLRVWGLGAASLWYDEALTLDIVRAPLAELAADVRARASRCRRYITC
jgi:hypothetical protein